jgi:broad specificity phosphatase PhoE
MPLTTLILVRHGETEANVNAVWHGSLDAPLTARGRAQVAALGARFDTLAPELGGIDAFYVSPLPRAQSTAAAIADAIGMQPVVDDGLREFHLGDWEGRAMADLAATEKLWATWAVDPTFAPPNGESPACFGRRAVEATQRLVQAHPGKTLLLVTHGGYICNVLAAWLGNGPAEWQEWEPHNCAVAILRREDAARATSNGGHAWSAVTVNDISHLPPEAIKLHDTSAYNAAADSVSAAD